jgi:F-type H+-transporting ATPase subunit b
MSAILEQLEINQTFFYQFFLFAAFYVVLRALYLKPVQDLIEKRNHKLKDDVQSSVELLKSIETRIADYEKAIADTRLEAARKFEANLAQVRVQEEAAIQAVKEEIKKDYLKAAQNLQDEKLKVESELKLQLNAVSDSLVQKVLAGN